VTFIFVVCLIGGNRLFPQKNHQSSGMFVLHMKGMLKRRKTQHEAARIVTGMTRSVSQANLYKEINWIHLSERRQYKKKI